MARRKVLFSIEVELGDGLPGMQHRRWYHFNTPKERQEFEALLKKRPELGKRLNPFAVTSISMTVADAISDLEEYLLNQAE